MIKKREKIMHNNDVTYNKKWETEENKQALKKLEAKYFDRSECCPDCPLSWAKEVLDLFETLEAELGIRYNESTLRGYFIKGNPLDWFIVSPFKGIYSAFKYVVSPPKYVEKSLVKRIKLFPINAIGNVLHSISYGLRSIFPRYVNKYRNRLLNNRIQLSQVKEKYGELRVYFSVGPAFQEYVDNEVRKCEVKLAMKGAYYPLESLYDSSESFYVGNKYRPDIMTTKPNSDGSIDVKRTVYRGVMKELGVNLEDVATKAKEKKSKED